MGRSYSRNQRLSRRNSAELLQQVSEHTASSMTPHRAGSHGFRYAGIDRRCRELPSNSSEKGLGVFVG